MGRIRITGYINTADLAHDELDETHPSGLSSHGYDSLLGPDSDHPLKVTDLEDLDARYEPEA